MNKITALFLLLFIMPFSAHSMETGGACALPTPSEITEVDPRGAAAEAVTSQDQLVNETEQEANKLIEQATSKGGLNKKAAFSKAASSDGDFRTNGYTNITAKPSNYSKYIDVTPEAEQGQGSTFTFKESQKEAYLNEVSRKYIENGTELDKLNPKMRRLISDYMEQGPNGDGIFSSNEGMPGFHAEVRSSNRLLNMSDEIGLGDIDVATYKLSGQTPVTGSSIPFKACANCSGILKPGGINILTEPKP